MEDSLQKINQEEPVIAGRDPVQAGSWWVLGSTGLNFNDTRIYK